MSEERGTEDPVSNEDRRLRRGLSLVLLVGLCAAVGLLLVGAVLTLVRPDVGVPGDISLSDMPRSVAALEPAGFFTLGFLVLLATPVSLVAAMMVTLLRGERRDRLFSGLALLVLLVIAASAYLGLRG